MHKAHHSPLIIYSKAVTLVLRHFAVKMVGTTCARSQPFWAVTNEPVETKLTQVRKKGEKKIQDDKVF